MGLNSRHEVTCALVILCSSVCRPLLLPSACAGGTASGLRGRGGRGRQAERRSSALAARQLSRRQGRARSERHRGRRHLLQPGADARSRQRGADRAVAFLMEPTEGNWSRAEHAGARSAERAAHPPHRSRFHGPRRLQGRRYAAADEHFKLASANPIGELTSTLARAWVYQAQDKTRRRWRCWRPPSSRTGRSTICATTRRCSPTRPAVAPRHAPPTSASPRTTSARCASRSPTRATPPTPATRSWRRACSRPTSTGPRATAIPWRAPCRSRSRPASARSC